MKTFFNINEVESPAPGTSAVTLGCFDGVHCGHREILSRLLRARATLKGAAGAAGLVTFDPPPALAFDPSARGFLLTTTEEKLEILASLGLDWALVIPFDKQFMSISAEDFLSEVLLGKLGAGALVVGHDVGFGHGRLGNEDFLRAESARRGFALEVLEPVRVDGALVSSTAVRTHVSQGDIAGAARLLGRPFTFSGEVVRDRGLGNTIGFPTANLNVHPHRMIVPDGVYAVRAKLEGEVFAGAMSIGVRPTVTNEGRRSVEVHIIDFHRDIYGGTLTVEPIKFLRGEMKFDSIDALVERMKSDVADAKRIVEGSR